MAKISEKYADGVIKNMRRKRYNWGVTYRDGVVEHWKTKTAALHGGSLNGGIQKVEYADSWLRKLGINTKAR